MQNRPSRVSKRTRKGRLETICWSTCRRTTRITCEGIGSGRSRPGPIANSIQDFFDNINSSLNVESLAITSIG